ncbi:hypothetical protein SRHO_G00152430 [Serrasalmus rhombeus]
MLFRSTALCLTGLRSVRQDMVIQRVSGPECASVLERTVRFLLYASYRLCGQPLRLYDPHINDTHLQESLSWLLECYSEGTAPAPGRVPGPQPALQSGVHHVLSSTPSSYRIRCGTLHRFSWLWHSIGPTWNATLSGSSAWPRDWTFCRACALHRHLLSCRRDLLLLYSHGHSSRNCRFPIQKLADILSLECSLAAQLCQTHGIHVNGDYVVFSKGSFTESPSEELQCAHMHKLVDDKQQDLSLSNIIHGIA